MQASVMETPYFNRDEFPSRRFRCLVLAMRRRVGAFCSRPFECITMHCSGVPKPRNSCLEVLATVDSITRVCVLRQRYPYVFLVHSPCTYPRHVLAIASLRRLRHSHLAQMDKNRILMPFRCLGSKAPEMHWHVQCTNAFLVHWIQGTKNALE